jgi:TP901 family phage tail tape measure protein
MTTVGGVSVEVELEQSKLKSEISQVEQELAKIKDVEIGVKVNAPDPKAFSMGKGVDGIYSAAEAFYRSTAAASDFAMGMNVVQGQLQGLSNQFEQLNNQALSASSAFDSAKAAVATLSNEPEKVAESMRSLSKDVDYQVGSTELLKASYDVLSAGFLNASDQAKILKGSVLAATGGFSDVGTVSDAVTTVLNAYGKSADEASKITDQLIATQNAGKITVAQYGALIGQAASIAAAAGVSFEEFSAFVATATAKGLQAGPSITGLRQAISSVLKPTDEAAKLASSLGVEFNATALKSKGLAGILKDLASKGAATPEMLTKLFGSVEAVAAIAPAASDGFKTFNNSLSQINNSAGAAQIAADKVSASFEGQMTKAVNQANEALISLGNGVKTSTTPLLAFAAEALQIFNGLPEPVKQFTGVALASTAGVLTLGAAFAGILAIVPSVKAGYDAMKVAQLGGVAADLASATAKGISTAANTQLTASTIRSTAATIADGIATRAAGAAKLVFSQQTLVAAASAAKFAGAVALVAGAAIVFQDLFKLAQGSEFANQLNQSVDGLKKFGQESQAATQSANGFAQGLDRVSQSAQSGGALEGVRAGLVELQAQFLGGANSADKFGNSLGFVTQQQLQNQQAQFATEKAFEATSGNLQKGQELLAKYGLLQKDAGDKSRLGAAGIGEFKKAATDQIALLDANIQALEGQKAPNQEIQQQINAQVALLQRQKAAIQDRINFLDQDATATSKNATAQKQLALSYESAKNAIKNATDLAGVEKAGKAAEGLVKERQSQTVVTAKQQTSKGSGPAEGVAAVELQAEQLASQQRVSIRQAELEQVKALKQQGKITAEEAATKESELQQQITAELLKQEDIKLQAKKAAIEEEFALKKSAADTQARTLTEVDNAGLQLQTNEMQAQLALADAIAKQEVQRSQIALDNAKAKGDEGAAMTALAQLQASESKALKEQQTIQLQVLVLTNQQNLNKAQAAELQAQINTLTAQEALLKAQAEGKSAAEIGILQRKLELSRQIAGKAREGVASQQRVNETTKKTLQVQQQTAKEKLAAEQQKEKRDTSKFFSDRREKFQKAEQRGLNKEQREQKQAEKEQKSAVELQAEKAKTLADNTSKRLDLSKQGFESKAGVAKSANDLRITGAEIGVRNAGAALDIRQQLKDENLAQNVKQTLENQLQGLGFSASGDAGADTAAIAKEKYDREKALADMKRQSLAQEQAIQKTLLEFEIKKQEIAAKSAVIEAQKALAVAKQKGDSEAIALAQEQLGLAREQAGATGQFAQDQRANLALQQQNQLAQFDAGEQERRRAADLERAKLDANFVGGLGPQAVPNTTVPVAAQGSAPTLPQAPDITSISAKLDANFERLLAGITQLANNPRSLTVVAKDPVSDAGKIQRDISRNKTAAAGL